MRDGVLLDERALRRTLEEILREADIANPQHWFVLNSPANAPVFHLTYETKCCALLGTYVLAFCLVSFQGRTWIISHAEAKKLIAGWHMVQSARSANQTTPVTGTLTQRSDNHGKPSFSVRIYRNVVRLMRNRIGQADRL